MPSAPAPVGGRAAVLGRPIAHSLSPVLHRAAYAALGLDWTYEAIECGPDELAGVLASRRWSGLSITMPLKRQALDSATSVGELAEAVGAANTLLPRAQGWAADNTDVDGIVRALAEVGVGRVGAAVVLGAGGTAQAALAALAQLGERAPRVVVREPARAGELLATATRLDVHPVLLPWPDVPGRWDLLISTVPAGAANPLAAPWRAGVALAGRVLLDVVYHPWPTALAAAAAAAGARVVGGDAVLLHQACRQVELMTGRPAPVEAMRAALAAALAAR